MTERQSSELPMQEGVNFSQTLSENPLSNRSETSAYFCDFISGCNILFSICKSSFLPCFNNYFYVSVDVKGSTGVTQTWLRRPHHRYGLSISTRTLSPSPARGPAPGRCNGRSSSTPPGPTHPPPRRQCSRSREETQSSSATSAC